MQPWLKKIPFEKIIISSLLYCLISLTALFLTNFYSETTNTLENNQHWKSSKLELEKGVIGGVTYFITPAALLQKRLNLEAWLGYQEILYKEKLNPHQIDFDFKLSKNSYFSFLYNKDSEKFSGIRFSRSNDYPNVNFQADLEGKFLKKEEISLKNFQENNHLQIHFDSNQISIILNGKFVKTIHENLASSYFIGFRGGPFPASIENIKIQLKDSNKIIEESFKNKNGKLKSFFIFLGFIILINLSIYFLKIFFHQSKENSLYSIFAFNFVILIASIILFLAQITYLPKNDFFAKIYFKTIVFFENYQTTIESKKEVIERLRKDYPLDKLQSSFRVLFVGTSQTWGAGASKESDTFVRRLEKKINEETDKKNPYELINTGISGEGAIPLWKPYRDEWIHLNPKIVVINLSNNDSNPQKFSEYLIKYIKLNESKGIKTILVLEANAIDQVRSYFPENHQTMKKFSEEYHLPLIDLHHCLLKNYDSGFLWWDFVHPTSYGHALAADCIYPILHDVIQKEQQEK